MKLLLTLLTGLTLCASLPALAETTQNDSITNESPDADWHGDHRGPGWDHGRRDHGRWGHGGWRHHPRRHCGPFGRFWCDTQPE